MTTDITSDGDFSAPASESDYSSPDAASTATIEAPVETTTPATDESIPAASVSGDEYDYSDILADDDGAAPSPPPAAPAAQAKPQAVEKRAEAAEAVDEFPADLLREVGMTTEQAKAQFSTPEQLEAVIRYRDQQMVAAGRRQYEQQTQPPPAATQQVPAVAPPATQQQAAPPATAPQDAMQTAQEFGFKPFKVNPEEWDPATVKLLDGMNEHFANQFNQVAGRVQQFAQMESALHGLLNVQVQQAQVQYVQEFEQTIEKLGDEWSDVFGQGPGVKMDRESPQIQNRIKLDSTMLMLAAGRRAAGQPPLSQQALFERALRLEFPEKNESLVRKQVTHVADKRRSQFTARPTGRTGRPLTGEEAAQQRAAAFFQSRGMLGATDDDLD